MIVAIGALFLGLSLIAVISRFARNVPRVDSRADRAKPDERPVISPADFESTIRALLGGLRLDILSASTDDKGVLEMTCRDPRMVTGGRVVVRAAHDTTEGQVDAAEILAFAESIRGDTGVLKGIDIQAAGFTDEAYAALGTTPALVELIDGPRLVDLVRQFVPERAELLERHRSFSNGVRRHSRAAWSSGAGEAPDLLPH